MSDSLILVVHFIGDLTTIFQTLGTYHVCAPNIVFAVQGNLPTGRASHPDFPCIAKFLRKTGGAWIVCVGVKHAACDF
jgi:hypothetical protein